MPRYHYELDPKNGHIIRSYVDADNKTEARQMIAQAYREDTPRSASRSGFVPFHKCKLTWDEAVSAGDYDDAEYRFQTIPGEALDNGFEGGGRLRDNNPLAPSDPRIGVLMKQGHPVYYAHLNANDDGYFEGALVEVEQALAQFECKESHGS